MLTVHGVRAAEAARPHPRQPRGVGTSPALGFGRILLEQKRERVGLRCADLEVVSGESRVQACMRRDRVEEAPGDRPVRRGVRQEIGGCEVHVEGRAPAASAVWERQRPAPRLEVRGESFDASQHLGALLGAHLRVRVDRDRPEDRLLDDGKIGSITLDGVRCPRPLPGPRRHLDERRRELVHTRHDRVRWGFGGLVSGSRFLRLLRDRQGRRADHETHDECPPHGWSLGGRHRVLNDSCWGPRRSGAPTRRSRVPVLRTRPSTPLARAVAERRAWRRAVDRRSRSQGLRRCSR